MKAETIEIKNNTKKNIVVTIQEEPDLHETFKAVEKAIKIFQALEALGKDKENLREEISKAFEEFCVSGTPYSSFTIFEAGYRAGIKRGDK